MFTQISLNIAICQEFVTLRRVINAICFMLVQNDDVLIMLINGIFSYSAENKKTHMI